MRILITGASGLLGLNLALEFSKEHPVFGQVNRHSLRSTAFSVLEVDLLAPGAVQSLLDQAQPDWVIHCAALANLDACEADPLQAQQLNTEIPAQLAAYVARGGARLIHVSTDAVFDGWLSLGGKYSEEDMPHPLGVYAGTKLAGELAVAAANPEAIIARVNLFGWSLSGKRSLAEFFFNNLSQGKAVMGFTDVFFCPLLVNDMASIFFRMLELKLRGLYHVVSSECLTKYDFGKRIARQFDLDESLIRPISVTQSGLTTARSPNLTLNTAKLAQNLGAPLPTVTAGLERFYQQYQQGYPRLIRQMGDHR
jgi:dTDP-4-dehydrorhamnose reductase